SKWKSILAVEKNYFVLHGLDQEERIQKLTTSPMAYVRADWFVFHAAQPPLYHDLLAPMENSTALDSADAIERFLGIDEDGSGGWRGTLICDDYAGYKQVMNAGVTEAGCLAHARRKFHELWANHGSKVGEQALRYFQVLFKIEDEVASATAEDRRRVRQRKSRRVSAALHRWLIHQRLQVPDGS
ncbi:MAG: transposase, partial [Bryobacterales bacterium]|nr:transposase [Bryobacterales bacterium]